MKAWRWCQTRSRSVSSAYCDESIQLLVHVSMTVSPGYGQTCMLRFEYQLTARRAARSTQWLSYYQIIPISSVLRAASASQQLHSITSLTSLYHSPTSLSPSPHETIFGLKMNFLFFSFYQYITLSSRAVDGHQIYSGGSVAGKASIIIEISPAPLLIVTGGQKVRNLASFSTSLAKHLNFTRSRLKMQQNVQTLKQVSWNKFLVYDRPMSSPSLEKLSPRTAEDPLSVVSRPLKLKVYLSISFRLGNWSPPSTSWP